MKNKKVLCHNCKYFKSYWGDYVCRHKKNCFYHISPLNGRRVTDEYGSIFKCNKRLDCPYWEKGKIKEPSPTPKLGFWKGLKKNL